MDLYAPAAGEKGGLSRIFGGRIELAIRAPRIDVNDN